MTMRPLFLSLLTMNDNNGSEAKCLPVRGPRLNASHAVGLVREPHRTQATGPMALNHTRPEPVSLQQALHGAPLAKRRRTGARCERRTTDRPLPRPVAHTHLTHPGSSARTRGTLSQPPPAATSVEGGSHGRGMATATWRRSRASFQARTKLLQETQGDINEPTLSK
jgi:hypothetical protein